MKTDGEKKLVNIASSTNTIDGFINLDIYYPLKIPFLFIRLIKPFFPDNKQLKIFQEFHDKKKAGQLVYFDCRKKLPFENKTVDHILCSHFLEHLYPDEADLVLKDYYRVLKPNGTLHIILPDMKSRVKTYFDSNSPQALDHLLESTHLSQGKRPGFIYRIREAFFGHGLHHHWMYDATSIWERLKKYDYALVKENKSPSRDYHLNGTQQINILVRKNNNMNR